MKFLPAAKKGFSTFNATGRASQSEYWFFYLAIFIINIITEAVFNGMGMPIVNIIISLVLIIPFCFCAARRAHDCNMSGYCWLLLLIPLIGWLYLGLKKGDEGENKYGAVPNRE